MDHLLETWAIHNRINLYLLEAIAAEHLSCQLNEKARTVAQLFAHIHNVRLMWLKSAAPELLEGLSKLDGDNVDKKKLAQELEASGQAIAALLQTAMAPGGKIKGFKPHPTAFVGYLIAHESHHRGQVGWSLKFAGHPLDKKTAFGLWEWGVR